MSDLTTLTGQLADMKQRMIDRLTAQGKTGYTMSDTMEDIVAAYEQLKALDYCTDTITENGSYVAPNGKTGYNGFVVNVPSGGPVTHKKYQLLDRVYDDLSGDSIGTVCGFFTDGNNIEYAIVCLDAIYRAASLQLMSANVTPSGLPNYSGVSVFEAKETATFNCDKMMDWVNLSESNSSAAVEHCRSYSFMVTGTTYFGQLPNLIELIKIYEVKTSIGSLDPTLVDNPTLAIPSTNMTSSTSNHWASNWYSYSDTGITRGSSAKAQKYFVCPILEIPNVVVSE